MPAGYQGLSALLRLYACELYDPCPLIGLRDDQLAEIRGRPDDWRKSKVGELHLKTPICKTGIDFTVQAIN